MIDPVVVVKDMPHFMIQEFRFLLEMERIASSTR